MNIKEYVNRITVANPVQLLIINYELVLDNIAERDIPKARDFLNRLMKALDMKYEIAQDLYTLYLYVDKQLSQALFTKDISNRDMLLNEATKVLSALLTSWKELEQNYSGEAVMQDSQQVFAGLTYKNGKLEEFVSENARDYKV